MNLDTAEVNIAQAMERICKVAIPADLPVMMWGEPGLGKTFGLLSTFEPLGYEVVCVLAGCSEPTDLTGIPFNYENKYTKFLVPEWAWRASTEAEDKPMILFMDDIVTAPEQTQAAFYKTVHEKKVGNLQLRDNVHIIGAGNRVDDKSAVTPMPKALCGRFMHVYLKPDDKVWRAWATDNGLHPDVVGFIGWAPDSITTFKDAIDSDEEAFATPRTWHMLSRAMFALDNAGMRYQDGRENASQRDDTFGVATGIVGQGMALKFTQYVKSTSNLVTPEEIVADPDNCRVPKPTELDVMHATQAGCEYWIRQPDNWGDPRGDKVKNIKALLTYAARIPQDEIAFIFSKAASDIVFNNPNMEPGMRANVISSDEYTNVQKKWGQHLTYRG